MAFSASHFITLQQDETLDTLLKLPFPLHFYKRLRSPKLAKQ
jgi:hypothetical protein